MITMKKITEVLKRAESVLSHVAEDPGDLSESDVIEFMDELRDVANEVASCELTHLVSQKIASTSLVIRPEEIKPGDAFICLRVGTHNAYLLVEFTKVVSGVHLVAIPLTGDKVGKMLSFDYIEDLGIREIFTVVGKRGIAETIAFVEGG